MSHHARTPKPLVLTDRSNAARLTQLVLLETECREPKDWPRLSEDLGGPKSPDRCQGCGAVKSGPREVNAHRWVECDDDDRKTLTVVVLCEACSARLVDKHPRLYAELPQHAPHPGATAPVCTGCAHRDGATCRSPRLRANGGDGLVIVGPKPTTIYVRYARRGDGPNPIVTYPGPPTGCTGRVAKY